MEWLRGSVTEGGAATFGETELKTPVGRANRLAMAVHKIEFESGLVDQPATLDQVNIQLTMNSKTALVNLNNSDLIAKVAKHFEIVTSGGGWDNKVEERNFYPPLLYAKSSIYLGTKGIGSAAACTHYARIGYTLRYVSATRMVQALVD
jgi:hypothetical protein